MSLLSICQDAFYEIGIDAPSTIVGNTADTNALQIFRLANREGEYLSQYHPWQVLYTENTITLVSGTQTYSVPTDMRWIIPSTTWNRTDQRPVVNPVSPAEWAFLKGWTTINGLNLRARIRAGLFEVEQTVGASENGDEIVFEYVSDKWAADSGGTAQKKFSADTDTARIDEELITQGVVWRFKKAKGIDNWQMDYEQYQELILSQVARDHGARTLYMGGSEFGRYLGINVSDRDYG